MFASPSVFRRIAAMLYESVLLFAILFVAGVLYRAVFPTQVMTFSDIFISILLASFGLLFYLLLGEERTNTGHANMAD